MLLPAKIDAVLEKKCSKKYAVRFFYSSGGKVVFTLLTKIVIGHIVVSPINIWKICFEKMFSKTFSTCRSGFHYCPNNLLHLLIWINSWQGSSAGRSCCQYIERPLRHCRYVRKSWRWSLSVGKFIWAFERQQQPRQVGVDGFGHTTLNSMQTSASFRSHQKE